MPGGEVAEGEFTGDGPVDAFFSALNVATNREARLKEYHVSAVTAGRDALAEVTVLLELDGVAAQGQGVSTGHDGGLRPRLPARASPTRSRTSPVAEAEHHIDAAVKSATP